MVGHLHELMQTTEGTTAVLPHRYTAMVGASVALRANAVHAIGELDSRQQDKLPRLVFEAFMALLRDSYRRVHKFAVHALRRTQLPEEFKPRAKRQRPVQVRTRLVWGSILSSGCFVGSAASSLFGAGKAVLHPVACDQVPGARGRGQGTETLAKLGGFAA